MNVLVAMAYSWSCFVHNIWYVTRYIYSFEETFHRLAPAVTVKRFIALWFVNFTGVVGFGICRSGMLLVFNPGCGCAATKKSAEKCTYHVRRSGCRCGSPLTLAATILGICHHMSVWSLSRFSDVTANLRKPSFFWTESLLFVHNFFTWNLESISSLFRRPCFCTWQF